MEAPDEYNRILLDFLRGELPTGIIIDTPSPKMGEKTMPSSMRHWRRSILFAAAPAAIIVFLTIAWSRRGQ